MPGWFGSGGLALGWINAPVFRLAGALGNFPNPLQFISLRRHLHPDQASDLRGKRYNGEKLTKADAGAIGGSSKDQNDPCLPESTADRRAAVARLIGQNPPPTQQQIADAVGLSRSRTTEIVGEMSATTAPKLLNHGGKREGQGSYTHVARGETKDYITARLKRDGQDDLAKQVEKGELSARQAGIKAGFVRPQSPLTALKREQQIADAVGLKSQSRVSEIIGELSATTAPKLLNHGGKREGQGDYNHVERGTTGKDYITVHASARACTSTTTPTLALPAGAGPDSAAIRTHETQTRQLLKVSKVSADTFR